VPRLTTPGRVAAVVRRAHRPALASSPSSLIGLGRPAEAAPPATRAPGIPSSASLRLGLLGGAIHGAVPVTRVAGSAFGKVRDGRLQPPPLTRRRLPRNLAPLLFSQRLIAMGRSSSCEG